MLATDFGTVLFHRMSCRALDDARKDSDAARAQQVQAPDIVLCKLGCSNALSHRLSSSPYMNSLRSCLPSAPSAARNSRLATTEPFPCNVPILARSLNRFRPYSTQNVFLLAEKSHRQKWHQNCIRWNLGRAIGLSAALHQGS